MYILPWKCQVSYIKSIPGGVFEEVISSSLIVDKDHQGNGNSTKRVEWFETRFGRNHFILIVVIFVFNLIIMSFYCFFIIFRYVNRNLKSHFSFLVSPCFLYFVKRPFIVQVHKDFVDDNQSKHDQCPIQNGQESIDRFQSLCHLARCSIRRQNQIVNTKFTQSKFCGT